MPKPKVEQGPFYIHIEDPGFGEAPWPGVRRLGPYLTSDEALAQAVSDAASGQGVALGVFSELASEARNEPADSEVAQAEQVLGMGAGADETERAWAKAVVERKRVGRVAATHTRSEIERKGEAERRRREKLAKMEAASQAERDKALQGFLPEGVKVADLREQGVIR